MNNRWLPTVTRYRRANGRQFRLGVSIAAAIFILTAAGVAGWLTYCGSQVRSNLQATIRLVPDLRSDIVNADAAGAQTTFRSMQAHIDAAHDAATDPVWKAAGFIPVLGANFSVVTEVAVTANDVADRAVAPLLNEYQSLNWEHLAPVNGQIDLAPIQSAAPRLSTAASTVQFSYERLRNLDRSHLLDQVADPLDQATEELDGMRKALNGASSAATLLPSMLGSKDARNYLVLIQNSAEVRATGGIPGALAVLTAEGGRLDLTAQASASDMARFDPPVIVAADQASIFSTRVGRFIQSVNLTPDFPTAAQTAAIMWEERHEDSTIDGVVALDPTVLAHILEGTGPVELTFEDPLVGELLTRSGLPTALTAENVVPTLLSDVYAAIEDPALQDAYFAAVAAEIFDAFSSGTGTSEALVQSFIDSANEGRLYVWSANSVEQEIITSTSLAGKVTGSTAGGATFGAYFNDGTGAKMDYYVRRTVQLQQSCTDDGYLQYTLTARLTNTAPANAAEILPAYVTGGGAFGVPPGVVRTNFVAYGPDRSQLQTARINGEAVPLGSHRHGNRPVGVLTTNLAPGETASVEVDFTNVVQTSEPVLDITPTVQPLSEVKLPLQGDATCS